MLMDVKGHEYPMGLMLANMTAAGLIGRRHHVTSSARLLPSNLRCGVTLHRSRGPMRTL
jgi:hypothetical protein